MHCIIHYIMWYYAFSLSTYPYKNKLSFNCNALIFLKWQSQKNLQKRKNRKIKHSFYGRKQFSNQWQNHKKHNNNPCKSRQSGNIFLSTVFQNLAYNRSQYSNSTNFKYYVDTQIHLPKMPLHHFYCKLSQNNNCKEQTSNNSKFNRQISIFFLLFVAFNFYLRKSWNKRLNFFCLIFNIAPA